MFLRTVSSKRQLAGSLFCSALFIFGGKHMNAVIYRPYKRQDFKAVSSIINIIWKHESYYSPKTAVRLSEAYLRLCLTEQTFTQVALADGEPYPQAPLSVSASSAGRMVGTCPFDDSRGAQVMAVFRRNRSDIRSSSIRSTTGVQGRTVFFRNSSGLSRTGDWKGIVQSFLCVHGKREYTAFLCVY